MKTITFGEIKDYINKNAQNKNTLWLIGERKWSLELNQKILDAENRNDKLGERAETGIFLTKDIDWDKFKKNYEDCTHLIFFNSEEQFQFITTDKSCKKYLFHHCKNLKNNRLELKNVESKNQDNEKDNFRFGFAQRLGTIHKLNKGDKIQAIVDEKNGEWRRWHE
jgi:hypothetical protein